MFIIFKKKRSLIMLLNYFKIAWRTIVKNPTFSLINIGGLALGMAVSMQILLFVLHEFSYDQFHEKTDQIYRAKASFKFGEQTFNTLAMSAGFATATEDNIPEVTNAVRISTQQEATLRSDYEHVFSEDRFLLADPSILEVFSFNLIRGNPQTVLSQPQSVLVTPQTARRYFGDQDPLGQTLIYNGEVPFEVSGLIEKAPSNSTIQYDFIASLSSLNAIERTQNPEIKENQLSLSNDRMQLGSFATYLELQKGADPERITEKIAALAEGPSSGDTEFTLDALPELHFNSNFGDSSNVKNVYLFLSIALLVLFLALINYISLTTARSLKRAKEVGIRKVVGARKSSLMAQFYTESALVTFIAFGLGIALTGFFQPFFHQLLDLQIDPSFFYHPLIIGVFGSLLILCIFIAGSLPAVGLSAFQPVKVLKGTLSSGKSGNRMREVLIVFQYTTTVILIVGAIMVSQQIRYVIQRSTAIAQEQIITIPFSGAVESNFQAYKKAIVEKTEVQNIAAASAEVFGSGVSIMFTNSPVNEEEVPLSMMTVDENFLDMMQLEWAQAPLDPNRLGSEGTIILNERAVAELGLASDSSQMHLSIFNNNNEVLGVLEDFHYQSLHAPIRPLALLIKGPESNDLSKSGGAFYLEFPAGQSLAGQLALLRDIQKEFDQEEAFAYRFLDDTLEAQYASEKRLTVMLTTFTILAIIISSLGLLGLILYTTERRTKEIGIRKVLGASVSHIVALLSKDFIQLILIAVVLASPIAWFLMHKWLENFAYQIDIQWWVFAITALIAVGMALLTIGWQSFKTAMANPVKALRNE
jgi:putative ABC transport system permease protein